MARRPRPLPVPVGGFKHIAVLRLSSLGDVVLTLPALHALKQAYPNARIAYWTKEEYADAVRFDPAVAHVRELERDARRVEDLVSMSAELEDVDLIVDLHVNVRTGVLRFRQQAPTLRVPSTRLARARWVHARWSRPRPAPHALERYAEALAPLGIRPDAVPQLSAGEVAEAWARGWLASWRPSAADLSPDEDASWFKRRPPIVMCPAAAHLTKRWIEAHWLAVHDRLAAAGHPLIYFSLAGERELFPVLSTRVDMDTRARWCVEPLPRVAALMSHAACAVTCDSGLMHVAAARGLRVVALFGSTAPELGFAPAGDGHVVLCRHEPCQPCTLHGRAECPKRHFRCMNLITADEVVEGVERLLGVPASAAS